MSPSAVPRRGSVPLLALVLILSFTTIAPGAAQGPGDKIDPELRDSARAGSLDRFFVVLAEQADLSAAAALSEKRLKARYVFETLRATAERTQAPLQGLLTDRGLEVSSYFVINQLLVEAPSGRSISLADLDELAARGDVARLEPVRPAFLPDALPGYAAAPGSGDPEEASRGIVRWNVHAIGADQLHDLGITGAGLVVGVLDSGADHQHPGLTEKYRGSNGVHDYNWLDPSSDGSLTPVDSNGHGTHVTGTAVRSTDSAGVRVAIGAEWIHCRGLGPGASAATILTCLQFFLAPTDLAGQNPDPDLAPDVTNHSYICPFCGLQTAFANLESAGIFAAAGAGNAGPTCGSVFDPATYANLIAIGGTDPTDRHAALGDYSSRGPNIDGSGIRPHLVAPGTDIQSSFPGGGFGLLTGTSMATPHVTGAVALIWQARPELRGQVVATREVLHRSAFPRLNVGNDCPVPGPMPPPVPNNLYGNGFLDVVAALRLFGDGFETTDTTRWSATVP